MVASTSCVAVNATTYVNVASQQFDRNNSIYLPTTGIVSSGTAFTINLTSSIDLSIGETVFRFRNNGSTAFWTNPMSFSSTAGQATTFTYTATADFESFSINPAFSALYTNICLYTAGSTCGTIGGGASAYDSSSFGKALSFASDLSISGFSSLSIPEQEAIARKLMPSTQASGASASGQTSLSATGMVFDKAGTFNGDLSGMRATQARLVAKDQRDFKVLTSGMAFKQMAESLSAAPINFRTSQAKGYGLFEGAKAANYSLYTPGEMSGWVQGNVTYNRLGTKENLTGSTTNAATVIGAVERAVSQDVLVGVMYSRTDSDSTMMESAGAIKNKQNQIGLYGQKLLGDLKLTGIVTYGQNSYDSARNVTIGSTAEVAAAKYDGTTTQLSLGASKQYQYQDMMLEPFMLGTYTVNKTDAFSETGASTYGLTVGATKSRDFAVTFGSVFTKDMVFAGKQAKLKLKPAVRLNNQIEAADASIAIGSSTGTSAGRINDTATALFAAEVQVSESKDRTWKFGADVEKSANTSFGKLFAQYEIKFH